MSSFEQKYEQIIAYLNGLLSNKQRHDLEKKMMQDAFDEEAFEGLSRMSAHEVEEDMHILSGRMNARIQKGKKRNLLPVFRMAAAIVVLLGIAGLLFLILRQPSTDLITQNQEKVKANQDTTLPKGSLQAENQTSEAQSPKPVFKPSVVQKEGTPVLAENRQDEKDGLEVVQEISVEGIKEEMPSPSETRQKSAQALPLTEQEDQNKLAYISGKVVGVDGEALPGVTITEKGTSRGTMTDLNGNFSIQVGDTGSDILLSYTGYEPVELHAGDLSDKPITLQEDLLALDEVVVVGYGTQKKKDETGAVNYIEANNTYSFVSPVPPGGTLKAFKNRVIEQIDPSQFKSFPGKHRIQVILTVMHDGSISDIRIRSNAPSPITEVCRKIISQSPPWTPALKDEEPVASDVFLRFVLTVE